MAWLTDSCETLVLDVNVVLATRLTAVDTLVQSAWIVRAFMSSGIYLLQSTMYSPSKRIGTVLVATFFSLRCVYHPNELVLTLLPCMIT
jgi:uncharacterized protein (DUF486 family)